MKGKSRSAEAKTKPSEEKVERNEREKREKRREEGVYIYFVTFFFFLFSSGDVSIKNNVLIPVFSPLCDMNVCVCKEAIDPRQ